MCLARVFLIGVIGLCTYDVVAIVSVFLPWISSNALVHGEFAVSMVRLAHMLEAQGVPVSIKGFWGDSLVPRARNDATTEFYNGTASHMLFVDTDIEFVPEDVIRMLNLNKEVLYGIYRVKNEKLAWAGDVYRNISDPPGLYRPKVVRGVPLTPTGFMLISRAAIAKILQRNPERWYLDRFEHFRVFDFFPAGLTGNGEYQSEDYGFATLCFKSGVEVMAYGDAKLTHFGRTGFSGNFHVSRSKSAGPPGSTAPRVDL